MPAMIRDKLPAESDFFCCFRQNERSERVGFAPIALDGIMFHQLIYFPVNWSTGDQFVPVKVKQNINQHTGT